MRTVQTRLAARAEPVPQSALGEAGAAPPTVLAPPRRVAPRDALALLRPRQWIKNGLVVAAAGAAGALGHDDVPLRVGLAGLAFCLLASGLYAVNDVRDALEDRGHPDKSRRPVAAGTISPAFALTLGAALLTLGLLLCLAIRPLLGLVGAAYLALILSYTLLWRYVPVFDVLAIAGGFVLRAVAGGVAAPVGLSRWFLLVVTAAAVFVTAGKRDSELRRTRAASARARRVLRSYPPIALRVMMAASALVAVVAYVVWAFQLPVAPGIPWRALTILPFVASLLRYAMRVRAGAAEAPEDVILQDRPLQVTTLVWFCLFSLSVNAAS